MIAGCATTEILHRRVSAQRNDRGELELGPMRDAQGMGDTLMVTPCAERLTNAVMLMPESMAAWAPLFDGLCPVRLTDNHPEFPFVATKPVVESNLAIVGIHSPGALPVVRLTAGELAEARKELLPFRNPVALVPTCSRQNAELRGRPPEFFAPICEALTVRHTVLQFGYSDYPALPRAVRMPWRGVRHLAALYAQIGLMVSVNTGDYHLMLAAGGRCIVFERPDREMPYNVSIWRYSKPGLVRYVDFHNPQVAIDSLPWLDQ